MVLILILRIFITLTFLILAVGGPIAIIQLRRFTAVYALAHKALEARIESLERRVSALDKTNGH